MKTVAPAYQASHDPIAAASVAAGVSGQSPEPPLMTQHKLFALGISLLLTGAVLSPIIENWKRSPQDGFPLSYYPMFTKKRREVEKVTYLLGLDAQGNRHLLQYKLARMSGGLNQVRRQITKWVGSGRADELCQTVATRVARSKREPCPQIVTVQVVTGYYSLRDYFTGKSKDPVTEIVHATRPVERVKVTHRKAEREEVGQ